MDELNQRNGVPGTASHLPKTIGHHLHRLGQDDSLSLPIASPMLSRLRKKQTDRLHRFIN